MTTASKIRLEVTASRPEDSPEAMAVQLAQLLSNVSVFKEQAATYKIQSQNERRKGQELEILLFRHKEWHKRLKEDGKNGIKRKISRMEPMMTYDRDQMKKERDEYMELANKFLDKSNQFAQRAREEDLKAIQLQKKIKEANEAKSNGS
jgi:hypothetical protein